jgi:hypothetical protein
MTCQLLSCLYFDGRARTQKIRTEGTWIKVHRQNYDTRQNLPCLWTKIMGYHSDVSENLFPTGLLLVRLLSLLELLTLTLNFGGYRSTSRNNTEEINLGRIISSGWSADCLFRYVGHKRIRGRYTPVIPRERWKGWRLASLLWGHKGVPTTCRRRTNVYMTVQQRLRC